MQVPSSTDSSNAVLSKRQQRAQQRGNSQGRPVTPPQPEVTSQRVPMPPVPSVVLVNNADMGKLRDLQARIAELESEKSELIRTHEAAMNVMTARVADLSMENHRMAELLAVKNQQIVPTEHSCEVVVEEKCAPLVSDSNPNTKGVPTPTVLDLQKILKDLKPSFDEFRKLHSQINELRNNVQTLMENDKLSKEDLEAKFIPHLETYSDLNKKAAMTRKTVEDNIAKLKKMHTDGSFAAVPEAHIKSMSSMNMLPMGTIDENIKKYESALKDCKTEIDLMDGEYGKVKRRFMNAKDHINAIIAKIDSRTYTEILYYKKQPKYEYVTSAMD